MLYLGIDLHKLQITINLRHENGDVIQAGQVSTQHDAISEFFDALVKQAGRCRGLMAIFEVCGFHDWLYEKLKTCRCKEIVVVPLANLREFLVAQRTKIINKVRGIMRKHNIDQDAPSQKRYGTQKNRRWLEQLELPLNDRTEVDIHLNLWKEYDERVLSVESELAKCYEGNPAIVRLTSVPMPCHRASRVVMGRDHEGMGRRKRSETAEKQSGQPRKYVTSRQISNILIAKNDTTKHQNQTLTPKLRIKPKPENVSTIPE
jgi:hypothetical protein